MTEKKKKEEKKTKEIKKSERTKELKKSKKTGIVVGIILGVIICLGVGGFFLSKVLLRPQVFTEAVSIEKNSGVFSEYFKEYLINRLRYENLTNYTFRELSTDEMLAELATIKDGFGRVSRGVGTNYKDTEFSGMAEIMVSDSTIFLKKIRELRASLTGNYAEEADRQLAFMKIVEEGEEEIRSAVFMAWGAYTESRGKIARDGVLILEGDALVEVGGGVMNILVGNFEDNVTAVSTGGLGGEIKRINTEDLFGYTKGKLIEMGETLSKQVSSQSRGLKDVMPGGKLVEVGLEVKGNEAEMKTTVVPLFGKSTWTLEEEDGMTGIVDRGTPDLSEGMSETVQILSGKKAVDK